MMVYDVFYDAYDVFYDAYDVFYDKHTLWSSFVFAGGGECNILTQKSWSNKILSWLNLGEQVQNDDKSLKHHKTS